tara:strand:- start:51 stop:398 length:348 start_codon:yes stop_codon:yes gene_type:complete
MTTSIINLVYKKILNLDLKYQIWILDRKILILIYSGAHGIVAHHVVALVGDVRLAPLAYHIPALFLLFYESLNVILRRAQHHVFLMLFGKRVLFEVRFVFRHVVTVSTFVTDHLI